MTITVLNAGQKHILVGADYEEIITSKVAAPVGLWYIAGEVDPAIIAAVWEPKNAVSLDASYLRTAGNEGVADLDPVVVGGFAPGFGSLGWIFNRDAYLKPGITPPNDQTSSCVVRVHNVTPDLETLIAFGTYALNYSGAFFIQISNKAGRNHVFRNGGQLLYLNPVSSGVFAIAGNTAYFNGNPVGTCAAGGDDFRVMFIGGVNIGMPTGSALFAGIISEIAFYKNVPLTGDQVAAITTAVNLR